jgi:hypothetical protein
LTFFAGAEPAGEAKVIARKSARGSLQNTEPDLFSAKAEELSLFNPAGRQPRRQAHQCLGGEVRWFSAIDDGRGDVGRQPGKAQEGIG